MSLYLSDLYPIKLHRCILPIKILWVAIYFWNSTVKIIFYIYKAVCDGGVSRMLLNNNINSKIMRIQLK